MSFVNLWARFLRWHSSICIDLLLSSYLTVFVVIHKTFGWNRNYMRLNIYIWGDRNIIMIAKKNNSQNTWLVNLLVIALIYVYDCSTRNQNPLQLILQINEESFLICMIYILFVEKFDFANVYLCRVKHFIYVSEKYPICRTRKTGWKCFLSITVLFAVSVVCDYCFCSFKSSYRSQHCWIFTISTRTNLKNFDFARLMKNAFERFPITSCNDFYSTKMTNSFRQIHRLEN